MVVYSAVEFGLWLGICAATSIVLVELVKELALWWILADDDNDDDAPGGGLHSQNFW